MEVKKVEKNIVPAEIENILKILEKAGFQAFLVGGCVRDIILGRTPKDWDITTNAAPDQIIPLFGKTVYENKFGTVAVINENTYNPTLRNVEITPYRIESAYSDKRRPDEVKFSNKIEDDLKRRDFTINAMAMSYRDGSIKDMVDLFGGISDLKNKVIKTVGKPEDRFNEDALRIMRAIRLAVELEFDIDKATISAIKSSAELIENVSAERIREEFTRIIMSKHPKRGLDVLRETSLLSHIIPELTDTIGIEQRGVHIFDVWEHITRSLQHAADKNWSLEIRLAALFHDISKPATRRFSREANSYTFFGHEVVGSRETRKILERLRFSRATIDKVATLVRWHMFFSDTEQITLSAVRRMINNVGKENIWDLINVRLCDRIGTGRPKESPYRLRKYRAMLEEAMKDPISVGMLKIDGNDLMKKLHVKPGPRIGYMLHALLEEVLEEPKLNTEEYLYKRATELSTLDEKELRSLGEKGKQFIYSVKQKEIGEIRKRHGVS